VPAPEPAGAAGAATPTAGAAGPVLFARFAYPPNALGYCGPDDAPALLGYAGRRDGGSSAELAELARRFAGAWPYLQLIAAASGRTDPLEAAVVEAYWIGSALLERVPPRLFAAHLDDRFSRRAGAGFADLATLAVSGGVPHHNFHVFAVYPWVGLLRAGPGAAEPLRVLDSCRVRCGRVNTVHDGLAEVVSRPLEWDGHRLCQGVPRADAVRVATAGATLAPRVRPGDLVAVHWDWVCDVLHPARAAALRHYTARMLRLANDTLARPAADAVLG
jgi:hypothetical protein